MAKNIEVELRSVDHARRVQRRLDTRNILSRQDRKYLIVHVPEKMTSDQVFALCLELAA